MDNLNVNLTTSQYECVEKIFNFLKDYHRLDNYSKGPFSVDGFAGTGKTTIIGYLASEIKRNNSLHTSRIAFLTFTGKASSVLKTKLSDFNVLDEDIDFVGTLHSFLYVPILEYNKELKIREIVGWKKRDNIISEYDLVIVDESSMIDMGILQDLIEHGVPVIMFGDSFQLPPVSENNTNWYLYNPDYVLSEIHRQALDNPIIYLSKYVRENFYIPKGIFSKTVFKLDWKDQNTKDLFYNIDHTTDYENINNMCILSAFNKTRESINKVVRKKLGFPEDIPICASEKVICLNNDRVISNGQLGIVLFEKYKSVYDLWSLDIKFDNGIIHQVYCPDKFFENSKKYNPHDEVKILKRRHPKVSKSINAFTYGYCLTVHKSQGSEFDKVVLFEERLPRMNDYEYARWLYTAITRSKEKLFIIHR